MSGIEPPSGWSTPPVIGPPEVPDAPTPDVNRAAAEAIYAQAAMPRNIMPPPTMAPLPNESLTYAQQEKSAAVGDVLHVLAGSDSGSIENLVNQAVANRPPRQGPAPSSHERARMVQHLKALLAGRYGDSLRDMLKAGGRALRGEKLRVRRNLRG